MLFFLVLLLLLGISSSSAHKHLSVLVDDSFVLNLVPEEFLSFNVDSASLYSGDLRTGADKRTPFDFTDPKLIEFASQLSPGIMRIGGSVADVTLLDFDGFYLSHPEQIPKQIQVLISREYFDTIVSFLQQTKLQLIFDFDMATSRNEDNQWNSSNAQMMFDYFEGRPQLRDQVIFGWQLGNEPGHWDVRHPETGFSPQQLGGYFEQLNQMKSSQQKLFGPDVCGPDSAKCANQTFLADFLQVASGVMDGVTIHTYPIGAPDCSVDTFLDPDALDRTDEILRLWEQVILKYAPDSAMVIGETASTADGGCDGYSNRFISGFYWMNELGVAGQRGWKHVFRQDLAGYSGITTLSSYALLGQPGWTHGELSANPDYYTSVSWKKLMGTRILNTTVDSPDRKLRMFASCHPEAGITVAFVNMYNDSVSVDLSLHSGDLSDVRLEYHFTAENDNITSAVMQLNGVSLTSVSSDIFPRVGEPGTPLVVQKHSFGFAVYPLTHGSSICSDKVIQ